MGRVEFLRDLLVSWKFDKEKIEEHTFFHTQKELWVACLRGHIAT